MHTIGIDVGTGSARAGVFDAQGRLLASAKRAITLWQDAGDVVEQSSDQIWAAVCGAVREAVAAAGIAAADVAGIGFDATCSLVAVKADGAPVSVSASGDAQRNIIVWMDHRAAGEAAEINAGTHAVLRYVGGRISPEMETPKLLWLQRNLPASFAAADHFFDLADYLTWRATGSLARSVCTVTCKWTYLAHEGRWDAAYFRAIGLGVLADEGFVRIGTDIVDPGTALGQGLTPAAAADLGLLAGTPVGAALIDAHAGGVGTLGGRIAGQADGVGGRLAYIFGTSACAMASTVGPVFVKGVWGPYFSAMVPGLWLNEGGQSAAGAAIDHLIAMHPTAGEAARLAEDMPLVAWLEGQAAGVTGDGLHVVPEFLGNRSPLADPDARAVIAGLGLDTSVDSLVRLYVAGLCGVAYGLRQLLKTFAADGIVIDVIVASGGAAASGFVRQVLADATGVPVAVANTAEPVLLGAAMLGAVAGGVQPSLLVAMGAMAGEYRVYMPAAGTRARHDRGYAGFEILQAAGRAVRDLA